MIHKIKTVALAAVLAIGGMAAIDTNHAGAATFSSCTGTGYDISGKVTNAAGTASVASSCTISDDPQDFLNTNPLTVNEGSGFFSTTDWVFQGKIGEDTGFGGSGSGQSGTFNITSSNVDLSTQDVMLIFKSGNGATLVGYLIDALNGAWSTPYVTEARPPFTFNGNNPKDVSHISVYTSAAVVPLPAGILLMLTALGGLGLMGWRRRQTA